MTEIKNWTISNVLNFLDSISMSHYKSNFYKLKIDGNSLLSLNHNDLQNDLCIENQADIGKILQSISCLLKYKELSISSITFKVTTLKKCQSFTFPLKDILIGSHHFCDIQLPDLSEYCCGIKYEVCSNRYLIQDLESRTGIWLEIQKRITLQKDMVFIVNGHKFTVKNIWYKLGQPRSCTLLVNDSYEVEFGASGCTIGRSRRNSIVINDDSVESVHVIINKEFCMECVQTTYLLLNKNMLYSFAIGSVVRMENYFLSFVSYSK